MKDDDKRPSKKERRMARNGKRYLTENRKELESLIASGVKIPGEILEAAAVLIGLSLGNDLEESTRADIDQVCEFLTQRILEGDGFPNSVEELTEAIEDWLTLKKAAGDQTHLGGMHDGK